MAKKRVTKAKGTSVIENLASLASRPATINHQSSSQGHSYQGKCFAALTWSGHTYISKNVLGESSISPEKLMDLVKSNIGLVFPGGRTRCSGLLSEGTVCSLTKARFQVQVTKITPTSFTFKALLLHPFTGTAKHSIVKDGNTLILVQEGEGIQLTGGSASHCFNIWKADGMWSEMADNIRNLMIQKKLLKSSPPDKESKGKPLEQHPGSAGSSGGQ